MNRYKDVPNAKTLLKNMFIIDNNNVLTDCQSKCVLCPTYSYIYPYDLMKQIDEAVLKKNFGVIVKLLNNYGIISRQHDTAYAFLADYYSHLARAYKGAATATVPQDNFWVLIMHKALNGIKKGYNRDTFVKYIQHYRR